MFGHETQCHFAQGGQIAFAEEIFRGPLRAFTEIHSSFRQSGAQLVGREIDEHHLIGQIENRIGNGLAHGDAANLPNGVASAGDMLDI